MLKSSQFWPDVIKACQKQHIENKTKEQGQEWALYTDFGNGNWMLSQLFININIKTIGNTDVFRNL
jgi:hypothetical protein